MSLLSLFSRRGSAPVARERLQLIIAHERADNGRQGDLRTLGLELEAHIVASLVERVAVPGRCDVHASRVDVGIDCLPNAHRTILQTQAGEVESLNRSNHTLHQISNGTLMILVES